MALWLVCLSLHQAVQVRFLAGEITLCSCTRHFTLSHIASLDAQVYKWVPANLMLGVTLQRTSISSRGGGGDGGRGGVKILLVTSCYRTRDKFRPDGPLALMQTCSLMNYCRKGRFISINSNMRLLLTIASNWFKNNNTRIFVHQHQ